MGWELTIRATIGYGTVRWQVEGIWLTFEDEQADVNAMLTQIFGVIEDATGHKTFGDELCFNIQFNQRMVDDAKVNAAVIKEWNKRAGKLPRVAASKLHRSQLPMKGFDNGN